MSFFLLLVLFLYKYFFLLKTGIPRSIFFSFCADVVAVVHILMCLYRALCFTYYISTFMPTIRSTNGWPVVYLRKIVGPFIDLFYLFLIKPLSPPFRRFILWLQTPIEFMLALELLDGIVDYSLYIREQLVIKAYALSLKNGIAV